MELPQFKYNPNALKIGLLVNKPALCEACATQREYIYTGPFFSETNVSSICAWCIADGSAAEKFTGEFQDAASCEEVENEEQISELTKRTQGYNGNQQEQWLSCHSDFCSFEAYVGWNEIKQLKQELNTDIENLCADLEIERSEFEQSLINNGNLQGYLFKCLTCGKHRLHADME